MLLSDLRCFWPFFWSYFLWLSILTDLLYFFFWWLRLLLLRCVLVIICLLLQRGFTIFMRSLILESNRVYLVLLVVSNLSSFIEHIFILISRNVKQIHVMGMIQTNVLFYFSTWLIWLFFVAYSVKCGSLMVWHTSLKVKDIRLDCTERVVVTDVKACSRCWLSCLRSFLDNLYALCYYWVGLICSFNNLSFFTFNNLSRDWLRFVKISLLNGFFFVGRALVVQLQNIFHWLGLIKLVILLRCWPIRYFKLLGFVFVCLNWLGQLLFVENLELWFFNFASSFCFLQ